MRVAHRWFKLPGVREKLRESSGQRRMKRQVRWQKKTSEPASHTVSYGSLQVGGKASDLLRALAWSAPALLALGAKLGAPLRCSLCSTRTGSAGAVPSTVSQ